jgi:hypothetical protein
MKEFSATYSSASKIRVTHTMMPLTHYLMEQDVLLPQNQVGGINDVVAHKWVALKKRWALQGHAQVIWLSALHV